MSDPNDDTLDALADEFAERLRRGESPTIAQYADAHPELADEIRELFPSIQMMEQLALRREQQRLASKSRRRLPLPTSSDWATTGSSAGSVREAWGLCTKRCTSPWTAESR